MQTVAFFSNLRFESSVISDGSQTRRSAQQVVRPFESSVISDGSQTHQFDNLYGVEFESSVVSDGSQTTPFGPDTPDQSTREGSDMSRPSADE